MAAVKNFDKLFLSFCFVLVAIACAKKDSDSTPARKQNPAAPTAPAPDQNSNGRAGDATRAGQAQQAPKASEIVGEYAQLGSDKLILEQKNILNIEKDKKKKDLSQKVANSIQWMDSRINEKNVTIDLLLKNEGESEAKPESLTGSMVGDMATIQNKSNSIKGKLECKVKDKEVCLTYLLNLNFKLNANVRIIVRKSDAKISIVKNEIEQPTEDMKNLIEIIQNSQKGSSTSNSIKKVLVETFEVVNAKTMVRFSIVTENGELIGWRGYLIKILPEKSITASTLEKSIHIESLLEIVSNPDSLGSKIQDSIEQAQVVEIKDGSKFDLDLTLKKNKEEKVQSVRIEIERVGNEAQ